jgi:NADH:ubiquinone oxidoreductase subunit K
VVLQHKAVLVGQLDMVITEVLALVLVLVLGVAAEAAERGPLDRQHLVVQLEMVEMEFQEQQMQLLIIWDKLLALDNYLEEIIFMQVAAAEAHLVLVLLVLVV